VGGGMGVSVGGTGVLLGIGVKVDSTGEAVKVGVNDGANTKVNVGANVDDGMNSGVLVRAGGKNWPGVGCKPPTGVLLGGKVGTAGKVRVGIPGAPMGVTLAVTTGVRRVLACGEGEVASRTIPMQ
jgi:hypothetical protein